MQTLCYPIHEMFHECKAPVETALELLNLQVCQSVGRRGETDAVGHSRTRAVPFHDTRLLQRLTVMIANFVRHACTSVRHACTFFRHARTCFLGLQVAGVCRTQETDTSFPFSWSTSALTHVCFVISHTRCQGSRACILHHRQSIIWWRPSLEAQGFNLHWSALICTDLH